MGCRGPDPDPPLHRYVECVETLHARRPEQGVPVGAVASALGVHRETARRHLKRLYDEGRVERSKGTEPEPGDPWYYKPEDGGE